MRDFSRPPLTGSEIRESRIADRYLGQDPARKTFEETSGFKPLAERKNGMWKLSAYHVFNAAGGLLGYMGSLCANNSQIMGSQKWYAAGLKDLGQTYLNASLGHDYSDKFDQQSSSAQKFFRIMHNGWTTVWGALWNTPSALLGISLYGTTRNTHAESLGLAFSRDFKAAYGRPPNMELAMKLSVEDLHALAYGNSQTLAQRASQQADMIRSQRPGSNDREKPLSVREIRSGPMELRAEFAKCADKEFASESVAFLDWAELVTDHIAGALTTNALKDPNATYELNKFALMQGYTESIRLGSASEINISTDLREKWIEAYHDKKCDMLEFQGEWNKLAKLHKEAVDELTMLTPRTRAYRAQKSDIRSLEAEMKSMKTETLSQEQSRAFGPLIHSSYEEMIRILLSTAERLNANLPPASHSARDIEAQRQEASRPASPAGGGIKIAAKFDGMPHEEEFSERFLQAVQEEMNGYIRQKKDFLANDSGGLLFSSMVQETPTSTYMVGDEPLVEDENLITLLEKGKLESRILSSADSLGIKQDDLRKISLILHQGMFACRLDAVRKDAKATTMPLNFGDALRAGKSTVYGTHFRISPPTRPGVYDFKVGTRNVLENIQDFSQVADPGFRMADAMVLTDKKKSRYEIEMTGSIDCSGDLPEVTLDSGKTSYVAVLPSNVIEEEEAD